MIYHFTKSIHLPRILDQGLRPSHLYTRPGERPTLFFTTDSHWENTVFCTEAATLHAAHNYIQALNHCLVHIACANEVAPHNWEAVKQLAPISVRDASALEKSARRVFSDPRKWRATFETVPPFAFHEIAVFDGTDWIPQGDLEFLVSDAQARKRFTTGHAEDPENRDYQ